MGTVVFPDAFLKIFLDASASIRAQRRYNQLKEKGFSGTLRALEKEIAERDAQDRNRSASPLIPAATRSFWILLARELLRSSMKSSHL